MTTTAQAPPSIEVPEAPDAAESTRTPRRGRKAFVILGILAAVVLIGVVVYVLVTRGKESTDDAQVEADVVSLAVKVGGTVVKVDVQENQRVKAGDVMMQIDDADYRAKVDEAQAGLAEAEAQSEEAAAQEKIVSASASGGLRSARAGVHGSAAGVESANAQIAAAQAALERAQAEARNADTELARAEALAKDNAIPQQQLDTQRTAAAAAHAALDQAQANVGAAAQAKSEAESRAAEAQGKLQQSAPIDAQIAAAHAATTLALAKVKAAQAALALAELQRSYTKVVAPRDGFLSKLSVHEGQLVTAGQPVAELVPGDAYVVANFKETQIGDMQPGQRAAVSIDAYPHRKLEGRVESLSAGTGARFSLLPPDNATGNFVKVVQRVPVRIALVSPPEDLPLRAGLSADVTVYLR